VRNNIPEELVRNEMFYKMTRRSNRKVLPQGAQVHLGETEVDVFVIENKRKKSLIQCGDRLAG